MRTAPPYLIEHIRLYLEEEYPKLSKKWASKLEEFAVVIAWEYLDPLLDVALEPFAKKRFKKLIKEEEKK